MVICMFVNLIALIVIIAIFMLFNIKKQIRRDYIALSYGNHISAFYRSFVPVKATLLHVSAQD